MSAEEVYLLDKRTSIEIEPFVSLRGHFAVIAALRAFHRLEKGYAMFQLSYPGIGMRELFITGGTKHPKA